MLVLLARLVAIAFVFQLLLVSHVRIFVVFERCVRWSIAGRQSRNAESTFVCKVGCVKAIYIKRFSTLLFLTWELQQSMRLSMGLRTPSLLDGIGEYSSPLAVLCLCYNTSFGACVYFPAGCIPASLSCFIMLEI